MSTRIVSTKCLMILFDQHFILLITFAIVAYWLNIYVPDVISNMTYLSAEKLSKSLALVPHWHKNELRKNIGVHSIRTAPRHGKSAKLGQFRLLNKGNRDTLVALYA